MLFLFLFSLIPFMERQSARGICLVLQSRHVPLSESGAFSFLILLYSFFFCHHHYLSISRLQHGLFEIASRDGRLHGSCMYLCNTTQLGPSLIFMAVCLFYFSITSVTRRARCGMKLTDASL
ncbi:hypothetical protein HDV63DRAFT_312370 [Trichoderma sp. SZMC 28014]